TDKDHSVEIASVDARGRPVALERVQVTLYKVEWKWWWDKQPDSLAQYLEKPSTVALRNAIVRTSDGRGRWTFRIDYPDWGRYLLRVCDPDGGHCAGQTFYVDWPGWAGRERDGAGSGASVLEFSADKAEYRVGETAVVQLPEAAQGRALLTIENGTTVLDARWLEPRAGKNRVSIPITAAMTPNVYVAVSLVQPHAGRASDRPLRLYGIIPLAVVDPQTRLEPQLTTAGEWRPESTVTVGVAEKNNRPMHYTLAVVDEGLLSLTDFKTPQLHAEFYRREALGVDTWDLFDQVAGSYSAQLERLLALGGSDSAPVKRPDEARSRFPPVVRFLGPFALPAGGKQTHAIELPPYVGAVRVMLVAGDGVAYGSADKSVFVRQPLMLLPTMPRVVGPLEEIAVPVTLFVTRSGIPEVELTVEPDRHFTVLGPRATRVRFDAPAEKLGVLRLRAAERIGAASVSFRAAGGGYRAAARIDIDVRSPNPPITRSTSVALQPGERWRGSLRPLGLAGTNSGALEVSGLPALNLDARLGELIEYPHGCLEQTVSAAFPQLYLPALLRLDQARRARLEANIKAALERLRLFQRADGGFSFWPGGDARAGAAAGGYDEWASIYASHFLLEAERAGYALPPNLRGGALRALRSDANRWRAPQWRAGRDAGALAIERGAALQQAYRLFVLATAGAPQIGAMNRLREIPALPDVETWLLAAAYRLAGLDDVARALTVRRALRVREARADDLTLASPLRDRALLLHSLIVLKRYELSADLVRAIAQQLASEEWLSTQSLAYALLAIAKFAGGAALGTLEFEAGIDGQAPQRIAADSPIWQRRWDSLPDAGVTVHLHNTSNRLLFVTLASRGVPAAGRDDAAAAGLALDVEYRDSAGRAIDVRNLPQGSDLVAELTVRNLTPVRLENLALTQLVPAGWEILNERVTSDPPDGAAAPDGTAAVGGTDDAARADYIDIRDDRVLRYFALGSGATLRFRTRLNAAYRGRYYLPAVSVEAMYDASKVARTAGRWIEVRAQAEQH
ncbi:MAG: hypothetical protein NZM12_08365, partial [Steroidobacteraceae bacterium]|nr:hypothetical protein [Steroidobacteraceae bacterium]